ncbi:MAG: LysM peptidoglycan-binding domain-containing protein [Clostridia bacterium]|nr:LysM peptidoglycan-binding domain-containing protein [Clostridia bacterium]
MEIKLCDEFFYRVNNNEDFFEELNTCKENLTRNNEKLKLYKGEWIKIKQNEFLTHYVKPMQTLTQIANIYGVSVEQIKEDNILKEDRVFIGQKLKIGIKKTTSL